jgi:methylenetetrahydrofolate reductase (NADPH)
MQFSIEITPKTDVAVLALLPPEVREVSITFLPGADDRDVIAQAQRVREAGFEPIPHIPARSVGDRPHLQHLLTRLRTTSQIRKVLVIGGSCDPIGNYTSTLQLLQTGLFEGLQVGIAGHPEGMPHLSNEECDAVLYQKIRFARESGLELFIITQWSMNPAAVLHWLDRIQSFNTLPIYLGIPGPASLTSLMRFAAICGIRASWTSLRQQSGKLGQLLTVQTPDFLLEALGDRIDHFHVYTFGGVARTAEWLSSIMAESPQMLVGARK